MEFSLIAKHAQGGAQVIGFQTARVERATLHQMAREDLFALAVHDFGDAPIRRGDVAARLPLADAPVVLGRILPDVVVLGAGQDQLHHFLDSTLELQLIRPAHDGLLRTRHGFEPIRGGSIRFDLVRFDSIRFDSIRLGSIGVLLHAVAPCVR
jgi:hypothetical protein